VTIVPRRSTHGLVLLVPAIVLGLLIALQARSQSDRAVSASRYNVPLVEAAAELQAEQARLRTELGQLRTALERITEQGAALGGQAASVHSELEALRRLAGLETLTGAGVTLTLDDARLPPAATRQSIELAIVHSSDITDVLNAAWKGGAQGIAVNGERITAASACVGAVIQINGSLLSPPFVISIVGEPEALLRTLNDPSELRDQKRRRNAYGLGFEIVPAERLTLPAYSGALGVRYARPVP
jgi:uncharacterized protein YlxW (UPF0749 family)